jgi:CDP-diacylglycerol--glycerol-3-phosphate 3-phosphatidyltransferase
MTLARLGLLVPTLRYMKRPDRRWHALACTSLAMLTDTLDGTLARRRGEVSELGKILDPIADKLVIDILALRLTRSHGFPRWITGLLLFRDIGIVLAALLVYQRRARVALSQAAGKATTVGLTAAILLYIVDGERSGKPMLYVALVPFGLSFWQYGLQFVRLMRHARHP